MCNISRGKRNRNARAFDARAHLYRIQSYFVTVSFPRSRYYNILLCASNVRGGSLSPRGGAAAHLDRRGHTQYFSLFDRSCAGLTAHMCPHISTHTHTHTRPCRLANASKRQKTVSPIRVDLWVSRSRIIAYYIILYAMYHVREFNVLPWCIYTHICMHRTHSFESYL